MPSTTQAADVMKLLNRCNHQLVLAESCTAGLVASTLAGIPGASSVLIGSSVVYQVAAKQHWLGLTDTHFNTFDVVSAETSLAMATGALEKTPWATVAAAITGHLGPNAPVALDGVALDGIAWATVLVPQENETITESTQKLILDREDRPSEPADLRRTRQIEAANQLIQLIKCELENHSFNHQATR